MRIGFVDHQLDNFHANTYLAALRGPLADRGFEVSGATAVDNDANRAWCEQHDVPWCDSVLQLSGSCDRFAVLAPANPERHLELANLVLPFGKPTFIDKPLAANVAEAELIFDLAEAHGTPMQSCSALRSTPIQEMVAQTAATVRHLAVFAGGTSWAEYGIHPVELAISCLGADIQRIHRVGGDDHPLVLLEYPGGLTATITFNASAHVDFEVVLSTQQETRHVIVDAERLFLDAASAILDFFEAEKPLVDRAETIAVHRVLQTVAATLDSSAAPIAITN